MPALPQRLLILCLTLSVLAVGRVARAQDPPPRIRGVVLDLHATVPRFPKDDQQLADSRSLQTSELPGRGFGLHGGLHLYPLSWKAVTFGVGVDAMVARATHKATTVVVTRQVTETFANVSPVLSLNFGDGDGWSYLSGGIGPGVWQIVPAGAEVTDADLERLRTVNYGGGARWLIKRHLAFSLDVRFYDIDPGAVPAALGLPASPRTRLIIIGAGISIK